MHVTLAHQEEYEGVRALDRLLPGLRDRGEALRGWIRDGECWVARLERVLAGFVVANRSFFAQPFIVLLMVDPTRRRRSVGEALVQHVESHFRPTSSKLFTSTNESNASMHALYVKRGFVRSGVIENLDEHDPEIVYFKSLTP